MFQRNPAWLREIHFYKKLRKDGQSVTEYVTELKRIAAKCKFPPEMEKIVIRDKFVTGLEWEKIQTRLFVEDSDKLTLEKALSIALGIEQAEKGLKQLHTETSVNYMSGIKCYCCGKPAHVKMDCVYRDHRCKICHKVGHLEQICFKNEVNNTGPQKQNKKKSSYGQGTQATGPGQKGQHKNYSKVKYVENENNSHTKIFTVQPAGSPRVARVLPAI